MPNSHWLVALPWFEENPSIKDKNASIAKKTQQLNLKSMSLYFHFSMKYYSIDYRPPASLSAWRAYVVREYKHVQVELERGLENENLNKAFMANMTIAKTFSQAPVSAKPALVFTVSATEAGQITEHNDWRIA